MKLKLKALGLAAVLAGSLSVAAYASGVFQGYPIVGGAAFCTSTNSQSTSNTVPGTLPSNSNCTTTTPAGPVTLNGNEVIPADTGLAKGAAPQTVLIPASSLANGFGGTVTNATTGTGQNPVVSDAISYYIYTGAGTATFATFTLPPNPIQNQKFCLSNAGTGALTLTSVVVGTTGQTFVGTVPTTVPVMTATGTVDGSVCWVYVAGATKTWNRVL